jgi:thiol-disulfide isomerase/thioredoxin
MNMRLLRNLILAALLVGLGVNIARWGMFIARQQQQKLPAGTPGPDFTAVTLDGGKFHLAGERGHPVVLTFWASWCGPCMAELPGVERVHRKLAAGHVTRVYAVNTEGDELHAKQAVERLGLTMPVLLDDGSASAAFQVNTIPHAVVLDGQGRVAQVLDGARSETELWHAIDRVESP